MSPKTTHDQNQLGTTLVEHAQNRNYPDDEAVASARTHGAVLKGALEAVRDAKSDLEGTIRAVSQGCAPDVDEWINIARSLQDEADETKSLSSRILREGEAGEKLFADLTDKETYWDFLQRERLYNEHLLKELKSIKSAKAFLDEAESLGTVNIVLALEREDQAKEIFQALTINGTARARGLLETRQAAIHKHLKEILQETWNSMVLINSNDGIVEIRESTSAEKQEQGNGLEQTVIALEKYGQLQSTAERFWHELDSTIVKPRTDLRHSERLASIETEGTSLRLGKEDVGRQIKSLFQDLSTIVEFLNTRLPHNFVKTVSIVMMPQLSTRIEEDWLNSCIPSSLKEIPAYEEALNHTTNFAATLREMGWSGSETFSDWVESVSKNWLQKRRDDALDYIRIKLSAGVGSTRQVTHTEKGVLSKDEGLNDLLQKREEEEDDAWAAWGDDDAGDVEERRASVMSLGRHEEKPTPGRHSPIETRERSRVQLSDNSPMHPYEPAEPADEDDTSAWDADWGSDDEVNSTAQLPADQNGAKHETTSENHLSHKSNGAEVVVLSETFEISSNPDHVLKIVHDILDDAVTLSKEESAKLPVAPAAVGLFNAPNLILAMYRAVAPYYYGSDSRGRMFLYNDVIYITDELQEYIIKWNQRKDLTPRVHKRLKLDPEIKTLQMFGKTMYVSEMESQKALITDQLGGVQNFLMPTDGNNDLPEDALPQIQTVVSHIRKQADVWKGILSSSAWTQAVGSLISTVAAKLINDAGDLEAISADGSYKIAELVTEVLSLDDIFKSKDKSTFSAALYVDNWLQLEFFNQILQSNMADIRMLWFESDLSLYFTVDQVVNFINISWESSVNSRGLVRDIKNAPEPKKQAED